MLAAQDRLEVGKTESPGDTRALPWLEVAPTGREVREWEAPAGSGELSFFLFGEGAEFLTFTENKCC